MRRKPFFRLVAASALIGATALSPAAFAQDAKSSDKPRPGNIAAEPNKVRGDELNELQRLAVERGLA